MNFDIIVADCPWKYNNEKSNNPEMGGMTYKTLTIEALCSLNIQEIAEKDALLFSWTTMPKLKEGIQFIESNGFTYITCPFVWIKINPTGEVLHDGKDLILKKGCYSGMGAYTCGNAEVLLMGKKGNGIKRIRKDIKQIQFAPRAKHSEKPEIFQDLIESMYPDKKYIELFARRLRNNWACIGNEITGNDIKIDLERIRRE